MCCSVPSQSAIGSKPDKPIIPKKEDSGYGHSRGSIAPANRGKPQVNAQPTTKPISQTAPGKPIGSGAKPIPNVTQPQQPVSIHEFVQKSK